MGRIFLALGVDAVLNREAATRLLDQGEIVVGDEYAAHRHGCIVHSRSRVWRTTVFVCFDQKW